jgi:hypothetical protein
MTLKTSVFPYKFKSLARVYQSKAIDCNEPTCEKRKLMLTYGVNHDSNKEYNSDKRAVKTYSLLYSEHVVYQSDDSNERDRIIIEKHVTGNPTM